MNLSGECLNASDFDVPQLRPRFVLVGLEAKIFRNLRMAAADDSWRNCRNNSSGPYGENGWPGALKWVSRAEWNCADKLLAVRRNTADRT